MNPEESQLATQMRAGDRNALAALFSAHRERLRKIVRFRLDPRLAGRLADSDVLQETYIAAATRLEHFEKQPEMPAFLWLRLILGQQLTDLHRRHFQAEKRDIRKEVRVSARDAQFGDLSQHTSLAIASKLADKMTAVSEVVSRAEQFDRMEQVLNDMDATDREVIALRHFEELSNSETAKVLELETSAASKRYLRAMAKLTALMNVEPRS
ncbi:MAG: sigma-70 family RNA polymerase sigma factor [Pirellulaceae bacterium]